MINLRMRTTPGSMLGVFSSSDLIDLPGRLRAMRRQERSPYRCEDYIGRRRRERERAAASNKRRAEDAGYRRDDNNEGEIDVKCRERMCDWSYRVVDHFDCDREIVSVAFSCLDRFLDRCSCDRTAFELAAISCLHAATKAIGCGRSVSIDDLAKLSRGGFNVHHIAEMERIVLKTLRWRVNPPTAKAFIAQYLMLIDRSLGSLGAVVSDRAHYFAELSVSDYLFVTEYPSIVAYVAILNALKSLCLSQVSNETILSFTSAVERCTGFHYERHAIETAEERLWQL